VADVVEAEDQMVVLQELERRVIMADSVVVEVQGILVVVVVVLEELGKIIPQMWEESVDLDYSIM
jgi:hypothetical protein